MESSSFYTTLTRLGLAMRDSPMTSKLTIFEDISELRKSRSFHCEELDTSTTRLSVCGPKILRAINGSDKKSI